MLKTALFLVLIAPIFANAKIYLDNNFNKVTEEQVIKGLIDNPGAVYYVLAEVTIKQKTMIATKKGK